MNNRLETKFGDDGLRDAPGRLLPFGAFYRFTDRTFEITVWACGWEDAVDYCQRHSLKLDGQIVSVEE